jgi:hypothetical protein
MRSPHARYPSAADRSPTHSPRLPALGFRRKHARATARRRLPGSRSVAVFEGLVVIALVLGIASLIHLSRSRARVMRYHDIPTPRVNESSRGAEGTSAG